MDTEINYVDGAGVGSALHPVKTLQNRKPRRWGGISPDLWSTYSRPPAQPLDHYCPSPVTVWKSQALTAFGLWHLVRENVICIRHNPIRLWLGGVCAPSRVYLCVQRKTRVSVGSLGAGLARCQTNALHYGPIYLINWATLSAAHRCR